MTYFASHATQYKAEIVIAIFQVHWANLRLNWSLYSLVTAAQRHYGVWRYLMRLLQIKSDSKKKISWTVWETHPQFSCVFVNPVHWLINSLTSNTALTMLLLECHGVDRKCMMRKAQNRLLIIAIKIVEVRTDQRTHNAPRNTPIIRLLP